jgi:hypothetical protein
MIMVSSAAGDLEGRQPVAVVVTVAKGYDLGYVWKNQGQATAERTTGGYYINAAQAGEPPGRWWGPGARSLGLAAGQVVERKPYDAVYSQVDPQTGAKLGRPRGSYAKFTDHLARLTAAEPHATAERLIELEREAAKATRQPAAYTDVTVSFSKSISVLHASIRENARRARLAGDDRAAAYWAGREEQFQEVLHRANRAALEYAQRWAGMTRTGYHGIRVDGQEPGRFEEAGLVVTSWLHGTSRDGDPQDHIHNQIARITRTVSDGRWRALDTACLREVPGALQAIAATVVECELTREFGVRWVPRPDGRGNEIGGITRAQMDAYSTRTVAVHEKERELAQAWERRHGRAPNSRELFYLAQKATLRSRRDKSAGEIDWDVLARRWDAAIGGELAGIAPAVSAMRGAAAGDVTPQDRRQPASTLSRDALVRAAQKALCLVSDQRPTWTRHHLLKQLALVMPAETRNLAPGTAEALLTELADETLSGRIEPVVCVSAPEWPPLPASLRRELDGGSIYTRLGTTRYATAAQLSAEERLVAQAQAQQAPHLPRKLAARHLGADAAVLDAQLQERAQDARERVTRRGLRLDQAAAAYHVITSGRVAEVVVGPAGTGKTRVLAGAAHAWAAQHGDGRVFGTATSQNAANELRKAGVQMTANTTRLLASIRRGRIPAGSLILADEGSMISLQHLSALVSHAARSGCKVVLAGDQEQLAAVEGGGAMMLLADRLGAVQLAEPIRFAAEWERDASLRLRAGDQTALDDYDQHGRIHGAPPDEAMDQAVKAYLASYLAGHNVILTAADWARCRELSRRIRGDLIHLGLVDGGQAVQIAEGAQASAGDLIICRDNDHDIEAGLRDHRALRARRHGAHRDHAGHRQRNPAMAVLGAGPRHREQHGVRLHAIAEGRRPAARDPPGTGAGTLRTHPPRTGRLPGSAARASTRRPGSAGARRRARRRARAGRLGDFRVRDQAAQPGQRRPPRHPERDLDRGNPDCAEQALPRPRHGRAPARVPPGALLPGQVAVPDTADRRAGRPRPRRRHPARRRVPRPGRRPRCRQRHRRPDPPARAAAAAAAPRPMVGARASARRSRTPGLPDRNRRDDGRPQAAPRPARSRPPAHVGAQDPRASPGRRACPEAMAAPSILHRRVPGDVRL